jgi:hypothetical protein
VSSLLDRFKTPAPTPAPADTYEVLPPDAPKSDPALAADPVEGWSPVPPPRIETLAAQATQANAAIDEAVADSKRKRRRKMPEIVDESTAGASQPKTDPAAKAVNVSLHRMVIRHGGTFNLGNYQSAKVEVEFEASVSGDPQEAREVLSALVRKAFEAEAKSFLPKGVTVDGEARAL